nr:cation-transporting P-type ATPase [Pandoraea sp. XY-2]
MHPEAEDPLPPTDPAKGLTTPEAQDRLQQFGANVIEDVRLPAWRQLAGKFWGRCRGCWKRSLCFKWRWADLRRPSSSCSCWPSMRPSRLSRNVAPRTRWRCCVASCESVRA